MLPSADLAFVRAASCEQLKDYEAAALFFADAIRFAPDRPAFAFALPLMPLRLIHDGKLEEAWEFVTHQLRAIPHPLTSINASLVRYHQTSQLASSEERRSLSGEQIEYFEDAWRRFQLLPLSLQGNAELHDCMVLYFEAATFGYLRLDQTDAARALCDRINALFTGITTGPLTLRDLVTSPASQTIDEAGENYLHGRETTIRRRQEATMPMWEPAAA